MSFVDEEGWGQSWEVKLEQQTVRNVRESDYLRRKYRWSRLDGNENFRISLGANVTKDNYLKLEKQRDNSEKVVCKLSGSITNLTDKNLTEAKLKVELKVIFKDKTIIGLADYYRYASIYSWTPISNFTQKISMSNPWLPGTERGFEFKTEGIESVYLGYEPEYVILEINLIAEDPIGFNYDKNIAEFNLKEKWLNLKK